MYSQQQVPVKLYMFVFVFLFRATIDSYVKKNRGHNIPAILEVMENLLKQAQKL